MLKKKYHYAFRDYELVVIWQLSYLHCCRISEFLKVPGSYPTVSLSTKLICKELEAAGEDTEMYQLSRGTDKG